VAVPGMRYVDVTILTLYTGCARYEICWRHDLDLVLAVPGMRYVDVTILTLYWLCQVWDMLTSRSWPCSGCARYEICWRHDLDVVMAVPGMRYVDVTILTLYWLCQVWDMLTSWSWPCTFKLCKLSVCGTSWVSRWYDYLFITCGVFHAIR